MTPRSGALFARYVRAEMRAEIERECASRGIACREGDLVACAMLRLGWEPKHTRSEVVAEARSLAREAVGGVGPGLVLVYDVASPAARVVVLRWNVSAPSRARS